MHTDEPKHPDDLQSLNFRERFESMRQLVAASDPSFDQHLESLLSESLNTRDSLQYVRAMTLGSGYYLNVGRAQSSLDLLNKALPVARRNGFDKHIRFILMQFGLTYLFTGSYDLALEYMLESTRLREIEGDIAELGIAYNNIGLAYYKLRENGVALDYFRKAATILDELTDLQCVFVYINTGLSFSDMARYDSAKWYYALARKAADSILLNESLVEMTLSFAEGKTMLGMNQFAEAEDKFLTSYDIAVKRSDLRYRVESRLHLARAYARRDKLQRAQHLLEEALLISSENGLKEILLDICREKIVIARKVANLDDEINFQRRYIELTHELYNERLISKISALRVSFDKRDNLGLIADQQSLMTVQNAMIIRRNWLIVFVTIAIILTAAIILIVIRNHKQRRLWNEELARLVMDRTYRLEEKNFSTQRCKAGLSVRSVGIRGTIKDRLATVEGLCYVQLMQAGQTKEAVCKLNSVIAGIRRFREVNDIL